MVDNAGLEIERANFVRRGLLWNLQDVVYGALKDSGALPVWHKRHHNLWRKGNVGMVTRNLAWCRYHGNMGVVSSWHCSLHAGSVV